MARNLFRPRANYVFDYKPRFYNESKERFKKLEEKYHQKSKPDSEFKTTLSRTDLKSEWKRNKHIAHDRNAVRRLVVIITLLVGLAAYILDLHKIF